MPSKTTDKFEFFARREGVHQFCFTNKSPYHETIDFDRHQTKQRVRGRSIRPFFISAALVGASAPQVFPLRCLFGRKLGVTRV
ncbi:hypothetical protein COP1_005617 [Malus domestica]